jgi:hypothetical protein
MEAKMAIARLLLVRIYPSWLSFRPSATIDIDRGRRDPVAAAALGAEVHPARYSFSKCQ